jgi:hypothetical protein
MSDELELLTKELDLSKEPEGLLVRANDGQSFFIPNADLKRFAVKDESIEKLWSGNQILELPRQICHRIAECYPAGC